MLVTLWTRAYWSRYHLQSAAHLLDLAAAIDREAASADGPNPNQWSVYRGYASGSILLSVGFVEAAVNELYRDAKEKKGEYIDALEPAVADRLARVAPELARRRARLDEKIDLALTLADAPALDRGAPPRQDFSFAKMVRNDLVHPMPESALAGTVEEAEGTLSKKRLDQLEGKGFSQCPFAGEGNAFYPDKCIGYGCAAWVLRACVDLADEFFARLGMTPAYAVAREQVNPERFDPKCGVSN